MSTHVTRLDRSANELFLAQALVTRLLAAHSGYKYDIDGALEAGQPGMAFVTARLAFHATLCIYFARARKLRTMPTNVSNQVFDVLDEDGEDDPVLREAWRLETTNPQSIAEVRAYVEQYRRFFSDVLHFDDLPAFGTLHDEEEYDRYLDLAGELSDVFEHLGITGINLPDARQRKAERATVRARLRGDAPARDEASDARVAASAPEAPGAVVPPAAVTLALADEDARALGGLLREQLAVMKEQVSRTDGRDARRTIATRQEVCERLLAQLAAPSRRIS